MVTFREAYGNLIDKAYLEEMVHSEYACEKHNLSLGPFSLSLLTMRCVILGVPFVLGFLLL